VIDRFFASFLWKHAYSQPSRSPKKVRFNG
jgi:hypothetical protein